MPKLDTNIREDPLAVEDEDEKISFHFTNSQLERLLDNAAEGGA